MTQCFAVGVSVSLLILTGSGEAGSQSAAAPNVIKEEVFVRIGGIEQWISIRGQNADNPVILVLHGGPGVSNAPFAPAFMPWEKDFTRNTQRDCHGTKSTRRHLVPAAIV